MTDFAPPPEFDLPEGRRAAQRALLVAAVSAGEAAVRRRRVRAVALVAVAAVAVAVAPAFGIGRGLFDLIAPPASVPPPPIAPEDARRQTGEEPKAHHETQYEGETWAVLTYRAPDGTRCVGARIGGGIEYGCPEPDVIFRDGPVFLTGPGMMQKPEEPGFDARNWDRMWFYGLAAPGIAEMRVVMTDCSRRPVMLDEAGVFLFLVPRHDLHARVWPYRLRAYDGSGQLVWDELLRTPVPDTRQARAAGDRPPRPAEPCR